MDHADERLSAIRQLASVLKDSLPGDNWHIAHTIEQLATADVSPADALTNLPEEWTE